MKLFLAVAAGGALGALLRYLMMAGVGRLGGLTPGGLGGFPWGTLGVNGLGCFVLGMLVEIMALYWSPGGAVRAFLVVGIMGSFTTFSAFSLDVFVLIERGQTLMALGYVMASVMLALGGFWLGLVLVRAHQ